MKVQLKGIAGGCLYFSALTWDAGLRSLIGCKRIDSFLFARSVQLEIDLFNVSRRWPTRD